MMRALFAAAFVALAACSGGFGDRAREEFHAAVDAGAGVTVHVDNIAGSVNVGAWPRPSVDVRATKYGRDAAELRSVKIDVRRTGGDVYVKTSYEGLNHGSVRYRLSVPSDASLQISNVAGAVDVAGITGDVTVETQAGAIAANVGRVEGERTIDLRATTGAVDLSIAPDSSARVEASSTVGAITSTMPGVVASRENLVGARANGLIGSGSGRIRVSTTTGAIRLRF
ncbi:MAG: DUF4097 family beta strand repeat protein [Candidatus Eremiobacteraeota bacterium]|nr:DUF4097 family beta strand repeat protein [Candidatus Eremiobacteraeota bacterium]MBV8498212.1 DUF4097 family beta strand repeat protein [Candidatus Eremiobacteraeota bacterium]